MGSRPATRLAVTMTARPNTCIATEKYLCDHVDEFPIESDVVIAPHHGANNGSSERFIEAVDPNYVFFSAGHRYDHPRRSTALRYLAQGVLEQNMFRTDLGDYEGPNEWDHGRIPGHRDGSGDDAVDILIRPNGDLQVAYQSDSEP